MGEPPTDADYGCVVVAYMHVHAARPLPTEVLAAAVGVSARRLQEQFRNAFGMSPLQYLRQLRFENARDEFRNPANTGSTVADVARRWGFAHLGRFTTAYPARFGETPNTSRHA